MANQVRGLKKAFGLIVPRSRDGKFEANVRSSLADHAELAQIILTLLEAWRSMRIQASDGATLNPVELTAELTIVWLGNQNNRVAADEVPSFLRTMLATLTELSSGTSGDADAYVPPNILGTLATAVAVIAVAWIGFGMLSGHINLQRGAIVILGCFIVFGAPVIAAGLMKAGQAGNSGAVAAVAPPSFPRPTSTPTPYDPYAGASVPVR